MVDICVMATKPPFGAEVDGEAEEEGNQPGQDDDVVVPRNTADDADARDQSRGDKDGGQGQGSRDDGEDGRAPVRKVDRSIDGNRRHCFFSFSPTASSLSQDWLRLVIAVEGKGKCAKMSPLPSPFETLDMQVRKEVTAQ